MFPKRITYIPQEPPWGGGLEMSVRVPSEAPLGAVLGGLWRPSQGLGGCARAISGVLFVGHLGDSKATNLALELRNSVYAFQRFMLLYARSPGLSGRRKRHPICSRDFPSGAISGQASNTDPQPRPEGIQESYAANPESARETQQNTGIEALCP